jgi:hypothetical protein
MRYRALVLLTPTALFASGCGLLCDTPDMRTVTFSSDPTVTIVRPGDSAVISMAGTISDFEDSRGFDPTFDAVDDGAAIGKALEIHMSGMYPTGENVALSVVLPTPITRTSVFQIDDAYQVPFVVTTDEGQNWRTVPLSANGHGSAAFGTASYSFPPPTFTDTYQAAQVSGTVRVLQKFGEGFQLKLDLTFTDAAGRIATVRGNAQLVTSRVPQSCLN